MADPSADRDSTSADDHDDEGGEDQSSELDDQFLSVQEHNDGLPTLRAVGEDSDALVESRTRPTLSSAELSEHADPLPVSAGPEVVLDEPRHDLDRIIEIKTNKRVAEDSELKKLLMQACQLGHRAALERLLKLGVFVSTGQNKSGKEFKGYTPLLLAIKSCSVEIVSTLMDSKTTVVTGNPPPLFLAVEEYVRESNVEKRKKRREIVELLLPQLNIQLHSSYKNGMTPVHLICKHNQLDILELFQNAFSERSTSVTSWAKVFNSYNTDGWTPLMFAVREGHTSMVEQLLQSCSDEVGRHQLCVAHYKKHMNAVMVAVQHGQLDCLHIMDRHITGNTVYASASSATKTGLTVLHHVCCAGHIEILHWLLTEKSDVCSTQKAINAPNKKGYTPLLVACQYQKHSLVTELLSAGADPKITTKDGLSGLHIAAMHDSKESAIIAQALLDAGLDPKLQESKYGDTAYHTCCKQANINVEDVLVQLPQFDNLKDIRNNDGKLADDTRTAEVIPAAIKRRGPGFVGEYRKALKEGKTSIRRLQLLVLGEQRVGKTSLVRSMLGKKFLRDCSPTRGINMKNIGPEELLEGVTIAVDEGKEGKDCKWVKVNPSNYYESAVANNLPDAPKPERRVDWCPLELPAIKTISEKKVLDQIEKIVNQIRERVRRENAPPKRTDLRPKLEPATQHNPPPPPIHHGSKPNPVPPVSTGHQHQERDLTSSLPSTSREIRQKPTSINPPVRPTATSAHPLPPSAPPPPPPPARVRSSISKGSARQIERLSRSGKGKDPPLTFHTLDFAGQELYRPMHHCFITRRAMYIVVFNLQVLVKDLNEKCDDPLREIRYWMNNVYAHSLAKHPSSADSKDKPKPPKIILVGTHSSPQDPSQGVKMTEHDLNRVHKALLAEFVERTRRDDRFLDSIVYLRNVKGKAKKSFFPVENSMSKTRRHQSGVNVLQDYIVSNAKELPFLTSVSPVSWLKFEERLLRERERRQDYPLSTTRANIKKLADECGVPDFMTALTFFHDTGLVIDQGLISAAASTDADDSLIVLLNPQWLAKIMTEVIELEPGNKGYDQKAMKTLKTEGTVERCVLKKCWEELCDIDEMFDKICKILEIYYLLCPIDKPPSKYLVPTKLPDCGDVKFTKKCTEFFFEFPLYLPVEVYTHLVCVFLKSSNDKSHYELTSTSSSFCPVLDINWKVSLEANRQRLKIQTSCHGVMSPYGVIKLFHEQFLSFVCQGNMLGCLAYKGGPFTKCDDCGVFEGVVPCVVQPENGECLIKQKVKCPSSSCFFKFDVNKLLRWEEPTKPTALSKEDSTPQSAPQPLPSAPPPMVYHINVVKPGATATFQQASVQACPISSPSLTVQSSTEPQSSVAVGSQSLKVLMDSDVSAGIHTTERHEGPTTVAASTNSSPSISHSSSSGSSSTTTSSTTSSNTSSSSQTTGSLNKELGPNPSTYIHQNNDMFCLWLAVVVSIITLFISVVVYYW